MGLTIESLGQVFHCHYAVTPVETDRSTATKGIVRDPFDSAGQGARGVAKGRRSRFAILVAKYPAVIRRRRCLGLCLCLPEEQAQGD